MARLPGSARETLLALRVVAFAACVPLLTRLPLPRQAGVLEPRRPPQLDPARTAWLTENVDRCLGAGRPVVRPGCLTRGLTHYYFLRRAGVDVDLVFGVDLSGGEVRAHCWLQRGERPFLEHGDPRASYVETYRVPHRNHRNPSHARA